ANDFGFSDPKDLVSGGGPVNSLTNVIVNPPTNGTLRLGASAITSQTVVPVVGGVITPALTFTPAGNANGPGYATFTFQVQDDGILANGGVNVDPIQRTMTMNVTPVNDRPSSADHSVQTFTSSIQAAYTFSANDFPFSDLNDVSASKPT